MKTYKDVKPKNLHWYIEDVLPVGNTVFVSSPGCGKGTAMAKITADFTIGRATLPGAVIPLSTVITVSAEDDPETCTAHRLRASGADLDNVIDMTWLGPQSEHHPEHEPTNGRCTCHMFTIGHSADDYKHNRSDSLPDLERMIQKVNADPERPNVQLVVLDPLNQLAGCKLRDNQTVRNEVMLPLHELAKRYKLAVVLVHHFNKTGTVAGSAAIVETARHCLEVHRSGRLRKLRIRKTNITRDDALCFDYYITGKAPANTIDIVTDKPLEPGQAERIARDNSTIRGILGGRRTK